MPGNYAFDNDEVLPSTLSNTQRDPNPFKARDNQLLTYVNLLTGSGLFRFPDSSAAGTTDYFLKSNGDGTTTWTAATGSGITSVVEDTTPQLGGQLDVNGYALGDGTLELVKFEETASAVNEITIKNNSTTNAPQIKATGDDTNISLNLVPKGTGTVQANGVDIVTLSGTQTLTNKTLTSPVVNVGSDATGDLYYRSSGVHTRLPIGSSNQVLTVSSGVPSWQTPASASGLTLLRIFTPPNNISTSGISTWVNATSSTNISSTRDTQQLIQNNATALFYSNHSYRGLSIPTFMTVDFVFNFILQATTSNSFSHECVIGLGNPTLGTTGVSLNDNFIGFRWKNVTGTRTLEAITATSSGTTATDISSGLTLSNAFSYSIKRVSGSVYFYVDGVLKATHSTNVPSAQSGSDNIFNIGCNSLAGSPTSGTTQFAISNLNYIYS